MALRPSPRIKGEPRLSDEVDAVDWIDPAAGLLSPTTPELAEILTSAAGIAGQSEAERRDLLDETCSLSVKGRRRHTALTLSLRSPRS